MVRGDIMWGDVNACETSSKDLLNNTWTDRGYFSSFPFILMFFFDNFLFMVSLCLSSCGSGLGFKGSYSLLSGSATSADFIFDLQVGQSLMVEYLADVPPMEVEMGVTEMDESDHGDEDQKIGVFSLAFSWERIFTHLVTVWQIVDIVLLFKGVSAGVTWEVVIVAEQGKQED